MNLGSELGVDDIITTSESDEQSGATYESDLTEPVDTSSAQKCFRFDENLSALEQGLCSEGPELG